MNRIKSGTERRTVATSRTVTDDPRRIVYVRKLTHREIAGKFIAVLKSDLHKFPAPGTPFTLRANEQNFRLSVRAVAAVDGSPHGDQYVIEAGRLFVTSGFDQGDRLVLTRTAERVYQLTVLH